MSTALFACPATSPSFPLAASAASDSAAASSKAAIFGFIGPLIDVAAAGYGAKKGTNSKDGPSQYDRAVQYRTI
ncbi:MULTISPECIES: hypothetical protein [Dyadobacter]|uniref:Uncharacterized protein n=2 Tax=Dyadobacter TaxID=120831 RepID=A0A5R9KGK6_9BACT|nr:MULTISPECIES: hypothetical protein [Dyadobacter]KAA6435947.1 hypothetical protein FEM33_21860 [Dyadobacter flavalbus]TLU95268.1 hypothetical protein FEM55_07340 [Dyadobacter sediminis]